MEIHVDNEVRLHPFRYQNELTVKSLTYVHLLEGELSCLDVAFFSSHIYLSSMKARLLTLAMNIPLQLFHDYRQGQH